MRLVLAIAACAALLPAATRPDDRPSGVVRVAAAADLKFALEEVIARFRETAPGVEVRTSFGSSGSFFVQISNGAPMDLFLSADASYPRKLVADGAAVPGSEFAYGIGRIVLWVPRGSPIDLERLGMRALLDPSVRRIAIANPDHAPYGLAAVQAMRASGVHDRLGARLVLGQNVAQAAQFVQSGSAQIGVLAISLARSPPMTGDGRFWIVPDDAHEPLVQTGVLLKASRNPAAARAFAAFLRGPEGRDILRRYGFAVPDLGAAERGAAQPTE